MMRLFSFVRASRSMGFAVTVNSISSNWINRQLGAARRIFARTIILFPLLSFRCVEERIRRYGGFNGDFYDADSSIPNRARTPYQIRMVDVREATFNDRKRFDILNIVTRHGADHNCARRIVAQMALKEKEETEKKMKNVIELYKSLHDIAALSISSLISISRQQRNQDERGFSLGICNVKQRSINHAFGTALVSFLH